MRLVSAALGLPVALALLLVSVPARATTLFWEDFEGYSYFPNQIPLGDPVNSGLPEISEGADELWFGARFQSPYSACSGGSVGCDTAVQKYGGSTNPSRVARVSDEAALLFSVDTTDFENVVLSFDWRTFSASSGDKLVAGFFAGDIGLDVFGSDRSADLLTGPYAWSNWTELVRQSRHDNFTANSFALPSDVGTIWVAFWLDDEGHRDSTGDYGKVDNVHVAGTAIAPPPVPEPSLALLALAGAAALAARSRRSS
jgi:MYXO-CTERM domain-containing protein